MGYTELEKRQLFLRSYQFSRKQSLSERIKKSFFRVRNRVRKVIWGRFRSVRKLRKLLWLKLKTGIFFTARRRRFFIRNCKYNYYSSRISSCDSYCLW
ncbi:hypothetical protein PHJA_000184800 [Phtheirospermum japonicum]|uniref:Uncharacterized protein n=1 Tax=Phtheirospermum japonicum TaxID=374723 RepID=A0A830B6Y7_9LAMI|nr:hypothetical protein PHJA_000184800 [Phtheirospermum japonicum]